jgi:hypothetical protein
VPHFVSRYAIVYGFERGRIATQLFRKEKKEKVEGKKGFPFVL